MTDEIDFDEMDITNVLALPLHRYEMREHYRDGAASFSPKLRTMIYSNGTEHGFACESAEMVLELGPMLRRLLLKGHAAMSGDPLYERYVIAIAAGDHDEIKAG